MIQLGNTPYLYHYTSFESATKILTTRQLLVSEIAKLNDINESCGPTIICDDLNDYKEVEVLLKGYSQISLTMDTEKRFGFDIPAMWGHYARGGHGVCLVLQMDICVKEAKEQGFYSKEVNYHPIENLNEIEYKKEYGPLNSFIEKAKDELFFHKTRDWMYEQEYRLVTLKGQGTTLCIKNSIKAVILFSLSHQAFLESVEYQALSRIAPDLSFYRYSCPWGEYQLYDVNGNSLKQPLQYSFPIIINEE